LFLVQTPHHTKLITNKTLVLEGKATFGESLIPITKHTFEKELQIRVPLFEPVNAAKSY